MMTSLIEFDRQLFLTLNDLHVPWLDPLMLWFSGNLIWLPLYGFLLYAIFKLPRMHAIVALLCIAIAIAMSDQTTSSLLKPLVERPRPTWDTALAPLVHTVDNYRGGRFGFPSSHAANTFCTAFLIILILRKPWTRWLILWAAIVSYSRIYLGVHYPGDILGGALIGIACGWIAWRLFEAGCRAVDRMKIN